MDKENRKYDGIRRGDSEPGPSRNDQQRNTAPSSWNMAPTASIGECNGATIILAPSKITKSGDQLFITWKCSRQAQCNDPSCFYSNIGRI